MNNILYFAPSEVNTKGGIKNAGKLSKKEINFAIQHVIGENTFKNKQFTYYIDKDDELNIVFFEDQIPNLEKGVDMVIPVYNICRNFIENNESISIFGIFEKGIVITFIGDKIKSYDSGLISEKTFLDCISQNMLECQASGFEKIDVFTDKSFDTIETKIININSKDAIKGLSSNDILLKKPYLQTVFEKLNLNIKVTMSVEEVINNIQKYGYPLAIFILLGYSIFQNIQLKEFYNNSTDSIKDIVLVAKDDVKKITSELNVPIEKLEKNISDSSNNIKEFDKKTVELNKNIQEIESKLDIIIRNSFNRKDRENISEILKKSTLNEQIISESQKENKLILTSILTKLDNISESCSNSSSSISEEDIKSIISKISTKNNEAQKTETKETFSDILDKFNFDLTYKSDQYAAVNIYNSERKDRFKFYPKQNNVVKHKDLDAELTFDFLTNTLSIKKSGKIYKKELEL